MHMIYESDGGFAVSENGLQMASFLTKKEAERFVKSSVNAAPSRAQITPEKPAPDSTHKRA